MAESLAAIVLAAGAGTRLAPLTRLRPKALCPLGDRPLLDHALDAVRAAVPDDEAIAVNVHHRADQLLAHLARHHPRVHPSDEQPIALGTAGAVGLLRPWLDGRAVLTVNADTWSQPDLGALVEGWDGERIRILVVGDAPFGPRSRIVAALHPWAAVRDLVPEPCGLYEVCWRPAAERGEVEPVAYAGPFADCGTPYDYLRANLDWSGGESVIGEGALVRGEVHESVVWPGATVAPGEVLVRAIRASADLTVLVR